MLRYKRSPSLFVISSCIEETHQQQQQHYAAAEVVIAAAYGPRSLARVF